MWRAFSRQVRVRQNYGLERDAEIFDLCLVRPPRQARRVVKSLSTDEEA